MSADNLMVFTGNANPALAEQVAKHLGIELGRADVGRFSDGEIMLELLENVRGSDCSYCNRPATQPTIA